jgi:hypothetical protein
MALEVRQLMWMLFKQVGVGVFQDAIANGGLKLRRPVEPLGDTAVPAPLSSDDGCPICEVHAEIAEGRGYLERLAERAQTLADLPPEAPTTAAMARRCFETAREHLVTVSARDTRLRLDAAALQARLSTLITRLSTPLAHRELTETATEARDAWRASAELFEKALLANMPTSPEAALKNDPLYQWIRRVRDGDLEPDQAVAELNNLLEKERVRV